MLKIFMPNRLRALNHGVALITALLFTALPASGNEVNPRYDDAGYCSKHLAERGDTSLSPDLQRRCIIAIATTYIEFEQNTLPAEGLAIAEDISRHRLGTPANHQPGNGDRLRVDTDQHVIAAIRNRRWMVDGNQAWIVYDGYLKEDPSRPGFYVAERFTIENGVIREILIAPPVFAPGFADRR